MEPMMSPELEEVGEYPRQLILLLHAQECQRRDEDAQANGEMRQCNLPNCQRMKDLWIHMRSCKAYIECTIGNCSLSWILISHWKYCTENNCLYCSPTRRAKRSNSVQGTL